MKCRLQENLDENYYLKKFTEMKSRYVTFLWSACNKKIAIRLTRQPLLICGVLKWVEEEFSFVSALPPEIEHEDWEKNFFLYCIHSLASMTTKKQREKN